MPRRLLLAALVAVTALGAVALSRPAAPVAAATPKLSDAEFAALLTAVRPAKGEDAFDSIPWLTSVWEARQKAAKEGKPILLWEMDGHPLGCG